MPTTADAIKKARTPKPRYPVIKEIARRFSPRWYSEEPVAEKDLQIMFEAARWTPSGHNHEPWFFYCTKKGTKSYQDLFSTLTQYNQSWAGTAPTLILACTIPKNEKGDNQFALYDLGAAVISFILQAQALGYHARQIGLFDRQKAKEVIPIESGHEPFIVIALGKIGDYTNAPAQIIDFDLKPPPRKETIFQEI